MTLNITPVARWLMGQSSDFRLTSNGKLVSDCAPKQAVLHNAGWSGLICYNGVAKYRSHDTAKWLENLLQHEWGEYQSPKQIVELLMIEGNTWLRKIPVEHRLHTFVMITYENENPFVYLISNYERPGQPNLPAPADALFVRRIRPRGPRCIVTGQAHAVSEESRQALLEVLAHVPPSPDDLRGAVAEANRKAAALAGGTVSEACVVAYLTPDGSGQMNVYGDVQGEFVPPLILSGQSMSSHFADALQKLGATGPHAVDGAGWPANRPPAIGQPLLGAMSVSFNSIQPP